MILSPRIRKYWAKTKLDKKLIASRNPILHSFATFLILCLCVYLLWLPLSYLFSVFSGLVSHRQEPFKVLPAGGDALESFAGSKDCNIKQADIYLAPSPTNPKVSPFCNNRAVLLEALSNGGRLAYDEPFVGRGCDYHWFSTAENCIILERFGALVFIGDDTVRAIYLALNMLLREDLEYGGLLSDLSDQDRARCKCDKQFLDECSELGIKSSEELKKSEQSRHAGSRYYCERIPHAYIPVDAVPASPAAVKAFKDLMYLKPNPWQPSPVIFSFGHVSSFDIETATQALEEWLALALAAERNIPVLFLSPPAIGSPESNIAVWQFHQRMSMMVKQNHVEMLGLYNLTLQATSMDGGLHFGERVALVEAMMIINYLSKLETS